VRLKHTHLSKLRSFTTLYKICILVHLSQTQCSPCTLGVELAQAVIYRTIFSAINWLISHTFKVCAFHFTQKVCDKLPTQAMPFTKVSFSLFHQLAKAEIEKSFQQ